ncbi:MAG: cysteine dioxygenase family protein [Planctomycetes bacterium]|nr:cysteine dioxygenase family protein [Planctomycetota bacterium]
MTALSLAAYVSEVTRIVDATGGDVTSLVQAIQPLKARLLKTPDLLPARFQEGLEACPYTRNLLHADPKGRFAVVGFVWRAGAETPVHDHQSWGVVGCYGNEMAVVDYSSPCPRDGHLDADREARLQAGQVVCIVPPRERNIHKMLNPSGALSFTIHTYGDAARLCRVYDPRDGRATDCELRFHHQLS